MFWLLWGKMYHKLPFLLLTRLYCKKYRIVVQRLRDLITLLFFLCSGVAGHALDVGVGDPQLLPARFGAAAHARGAPRAHRLVALSSERARVAHRSSRPASARRYHEPPRSAGRDSTRRECPPDESSARATDARCPGEREGWWHRKTLSWRISSDARVVRSTLMVSEMH